MNLSYYPIEEASGIANIALHRTPYAPDGQSANIIKQKAHELRWLEHEAELEILAIQERVNALRRQIEIHDALVHPCRRLPAEILSEVFLLAVPDNWHEKLVGRRTLNFAQVCHLWRNVALTTPRLWTTLRFTEHINPPAKYVTALKDDMAKTAQAPLELNLDVNWYSESASALFSSASTAKTRCDEFWALLWGQSHRWQRVTLDGLPTSAYERLVDHAFPALASLSITMYGESDSTIRLPIHIFGNAPKVHSLHITCDSPFHPFTFSPSWSLTELRMYCSEAGTLASAIEAILSCGESLRVCHLLSDESCANVQRPTNFPRLEELDLFGNATALCYSFTAPNLQTLAMDTYYNLDDDLNAFVALQSMLARSGDCPSLRKLSLESLDPGPQGRDLIACLRRLQSLEELSLHNRDMTDDLEPSLISLDLLRAMVRHTGVPSSLTFLPNLGRLSINFGASYNNDADPKDPEVRSALFAIRRSRRRVISVDGKRLPLLQHFDNNGGDDLKGCCWPPRDDDSA
ncbi:hypothetical protein K523DRAFT_261328, partial [Schizophyllum commune Tattone D]